MDLVSRVPKGHSLRVSRDRGFPQGLQSWFQSRVRDQRSTGFRVSRDSGFPMLSRAFKGVGVSIIQKFQGSRDGGFQGFKARGLEGERAPRFS